MIGPQVSEPDQYALSMKLAGLLRVRGLMQGLEASNLECAMAQHLLVAADRYALSRLRRICERRLCETVEVGPPHPIARL